MDKRIFMTGGLGFLGSYLVPKLLEQGDELILLIRPLKNKSAIDRIKEKFGEIKNVEIVECDLESLPSYSAFPVRQIDKVIHLAAILELGKDKKKEVWYSNVTGTRNIIELCKKYNIPHLIYLSTAYTQDRNVYEISKARCEEEIKNSGIGYTILKPSIIIGSPKDPGPLQSINQIALTIAKLHKKAEAARLKFQDRLVLPPIELGFRLKGDPQATLSVIPVDLVVEQIINLKDKEGIYYITNPNPPLLEEIAREASEALSLNVHILKKFKHSPPEKVLEKLIKPFLPYMQGEPEFPTVVDKEFKLPKGYIRDTVRISLGLC